MENTCRPPYDDEVDEQRLDFSLEFFDPPWSFMERPLSPLTKLTTSTSLPLPSALTDRRAPISISSPFQGSRPVVSHAEV